MPKREYIVYFGAAVTDSIFEKRKLSLRNAPGTQRMTRIASALRVIGGRCFVMTSAIQPRIKSTWKIMEPLLSRFNGVPIIAIRQIGVKWAGYLAAPFFAIAAAMQISRRRTISTVVQYNHHIDAFAFGLWCKFFYGSVLVLDFEDVTRVRWSDCLTYRGIGMVKRLITYSLQCVSLHVADAVFVPSRKLLASTPPGKLSMVVQGCQAVFTGELVRPTGKEEEIRILLSGSLTLQNGLGIFFDALEFLERSGHGKNLHFYVCGVGMLEYARERADRLKSSRIDVLGTLSHGQFDSLYREIDLCLVLQDPNGTCGWSKSPSKGYEALCAGKTIVVTDIGDFGDLPDNICYHLSSFDGSSLGEILASLSISEVFRRRCNALKYAKRNYDLPLIGRRLGELIGRACAKRAESNGQQKR